MVKGCVIKKQRRKVKVKLLYQSLHHRGINGQEEPSIKIPKVNYIIVTKISFNTTDQTLKTRKY